MESKRCRKNISNEIKKSEWTQDEEFKELGRNLIDLNQNQYRLTKSKVKDDKKNIELTETFRIDKKIILKKVCSVLSWMADHLVFKISATGTQTICKLSFGTFQNKDHSTK